MITIRHADERGAANFGWLDTKHSFSFGHYYDPNHQGFSSLRVLNDDIFQAGTGFDTHPHSNMEIISYVLQGTIEHKDSTGNRKLLPAGEFQLMSAGSGISHSEYNASQSEPVHILQIWIEPNQLNTEPSYQQKDFGQKLGLTPIATPTGENGTLQIKQEARLQQLIIEPEQSVSLPLADKGKAFVQLVNGELTLDSTTMYAGDGAKIEQQSELRFQNTSQETIKALVFELP